MATGPFGCSTTGSVFNVGRIAGASTTTLNCRPGYDNVAVARMVVEVAKDDLLPRAGERTRSATGKLFAVPMRALRRCA